MTIRNPSIRLCRAAATLVCLTFVSQGLAQTGKCCLPDGRGCRTVTQDECFTFGGEFVPGQSCASPDDTCDAPVTGACCFAAGCSVVVSTECPMGTAFSPGTPCSPTLCAPLPSGACCVGGECTVATQDICIGSGGEWYVEVPCSPDYCHLGGCCRSVLGCVIVSEPGCEQGFWVRDGTCVPFFCVQARGSCCRDDGQCVVTTDADCSNGTFVFEAMCTPDSCAAITGACCRGATCTTTPAAACEGQFQGAGTACGTPENPTTCCPANFNGSGGVTVQDIFDFLAAYFANEPGADFNGQGGVTVQDIFDFLAAYFRGCM